MFRRLPPDVQALLRHQRWVLGTWQPEVGELPKRSVQRAIQAGLWRRITPRTLFALPIDPAPEHYRMAAVLELGPAAVLGGASSLVEWGWSGDDPGATDVLIPHGSNLRKRSLPTWIRPRYARTDRSESVRGALALSKPVPAAIDAAAWARSDREASFFIVSVVQQRLATTDALGDELQARPTLRRRRLIAAVLADAGAGATSMPELDFRQECRRRGLPEPRMQVRRRDATGRARCTDAEFDLPDGGLLIVEINGAGHEEPARSADDTVRNSALARATGAHVIPVPSWQLRADPDDVFHEIGAWLQPRAL